MDGQRKKVIIFSSFTCHKQSMKNVNVSPMQNGCTFFTCWERQLKRGKTHVSKVNGK